MTDDNETGIAVLDLGGASPVTAQGDAQVDAWRAVAEGRGMTLTWEPAGANVDRPRWGQALASSSSFAMQLAQVAQRAGAASAGGSAQLFRIELPAGQALQNLVPAVGGGFRGMTRAAGSPGFTSQARLIPVGGTVAAGGAALALGPMIGIVALTVGAEMLAQQQLQAKLDAIHAGVKDIGQHLEQQLAAHLETADCALSDATAALLDRIEVPEAVGLGSAITGLRQVKNQGIAWLAGWERVAARLAEGDSVVDYQDFREELGKIAVGGWDSLPSNMLLLYRSLALDSRAYVVSLAQANLSQPGGSFEHFESAVSARLGANAEVQQRLGELLWTLSTTPLTAGLSNLKPSNWRQLGSVHSVVTRLTRAITVAPAAPGLLTPENRLLIEAVKEADGSLKILQPRAA